jgi:gliding motility-associated-like protein
MAGTPIQCASSRYYLPTRGPLNSNAEDNVLDTVQAEAEGFTVSDMTSPNVDAITGQHLQDVWTKDWTEVTFDLSPYRGQRVFLTFEADNCLPGAHFGYAYVALRNTCSGLVISGPAVACENSLLTYSVPALAGATYNWILPAGWSLDSVDFSNAGANIVHLNVGSTGGQLIVNEQSSCANLTDTIQISTTPPTVAGQVTSDTSFCGGSNSGVLKLKGNNGSILAWLSSLDGITWDTLPDTTSIYTYQNVQTTTMYRAEVQNGINCSAIGSAPGTVTVNAKSVGGVIQPASDGFCSGQTVADMLQLQGMTGEVVDWQTSQDGLLWQDLQPPDTAAAYAVTSLLKTTYFRSIVKNGACPADSSSVATIQFYPTPFPVASFDPADTSICHGATAQLTATIQAGTSYAWIKADSLQTSGNGQIPSDPYLVSASASPSVSTSYVLSISNAGCPIPLVDTFLIQVSPPIVVNVTHDTNVVVGEPLQLHAATSNPGVHSYSWSPPTDLNNAESPNPIGNYGADINSVTYTVDAYDSAGCFGENKVTVRVFKTGADIFVPNAFTPGKSMNNIFRPVPVGIADLRFFRVYNRWGQLVFYTNQAGQGWDGSINGKPQETGTYVWMAEATDYTGKTVFKKGTVVLIR